MMRVLLDRIGAGESESCAGGGVNAKVTEEGVSRLRVERNLTKILRC